MMLTSMPETRNSGSPLFPKRPGYRGRWAPVFMEPISLSGERLCIGVAAVGDDGQVEVACALQQDALGTVFGKHGRSFKQVADLLLDDLKKFLQSGGWFTHWRPPFSGAVIAGPRPAAARDISGILRQGLRLSACLSAWLLDPAVADTGQETKEEQEDRLLTQVREQIIKQHPELGGCFNKEFRIKPIYFIGRRLAANLDRLIPTWQTLTECVNRAKTKILTLGALRRAEGQNMRKPYRFEMLLLCPADTDALYTDRQIAALHATLLELKEIADNLNVHLYHHSDPAKIVHHLIEQEMAT